MWLKACRPTIFLNICTFLLNIFHSLHSIVLIYITVVLMLVLVSTQVLACAGVDAGAGVATVCVGIKAGSSSYLNSLGVRENM